MKTLVHAFILRAWTIATRGSRRARRSDTLQRVLNAAARLVTNTGKYDRGLSSLLIATVTLAQRPRANRIQAIAVMVRLCLDDKAPTYLHDYVLYSGLRREQPTPTISQPASTDCTSLSANYIRPSGFLYCGPDGH